MTDRWDSQNYSSARRSRRWDRYRAGRRMESSRGSSRGIIGTSAETRNFGLTIWKSNFIAIRHALSVPLAKKEGNKVGSLGGRERRCKMARDAGVERRETSKRADGGRGNSISGSRARRSIAGNRFRIPEN